MNWAKVPKALLFLCVPLLLLPLGGCSDRRPGVDQAKKDFLEAYPDVEIVNIEVAGDEVVARYIKVDYRTSEGGNLRSYEVQYLKTDSGEYEINPKLK